MGYSYKTYAETKDVMKKYVNATEGSVREKYEKTQTKETTRTKTVQQKTTTTDPETEVLTITWKIADILEAMQSQEFEATEANIRKVLDYKNLKNLEDKSIEYGWGIIFDMVEEAKMNKRKIAFTPNEMSFAIGCGAKKYVDYAEAMKLFGLGRNKIIEIAKDANAIRDVKGRKLVNVQAVEDYIEFMFGPGSKEQL